MRPMSTMWVIGDANDRYGTDTALRALRRGVTGRHGVALRALRRRASRDAERHSVGRQASRASSDRHVADMMATRAHVPGGDTAGYGGQTDR